MRVGFIGLGRMGQAMAGRILGGGHDLVVYNRTAAKAAGLAKAGAQLELWVEDEGPGLSNTANLFVPFFTTKPGGSGIGLALSRQIAEVHGGSLSLENRKQATGCVARLRLPLG